MRLSRWFQESVGEYTVTSTQVEEGIQSVLGLNLIISDSG